MINFFWRPRPTRPPLPFWFNHSQFPSPHFFNGQPIEQSPYSSPYTFVVGHHTTGSFVPGGGGLPPNF
ncbi:hypothetical protein [Mesobacillus harenae]|uniref:hypothetical protein n=1 Tax=Mesobacillus harenae TaxID=2213203 RepID=UPI00157FD25F|nr:hypothetical protein [Mesobacillus harenae]